MPQRHTIERRQDRQNATSCTLRVARRVREAARRNGSIERRDRASGRLHHPQEHRRDGVLPIPPQNEAGPGRDWLTHPALTGIPHEQWNSLVTELAAARAAQREADLQVPPPRRVWPSRPSAHPPVASGCSDRQAEPGCMGRRSVARTLPGYLLGPLFPGEPLPEARDVLYAGG